MRYLESDGMCAMVHTRYVCDPETEATTMACTCLWNCTKSAPSYNSVWGATIWRERPVGRPHLRYKDICKQDLQPIELGAKEWETLSKDWDVRRYKVSQDVKEAENRHVSSVRENRPMRKEGQYDSTAFGGSAI